jgi:hypothetical protein
MNERENGQLSMTSQTTRSRISPERWEQIKTAYASGLGLREIARSMHVSENTVLSRAHREGWSGQVNDARALVKRGDTAKAITPFEAASASMQKRGERHVERVAGISERAVDHIETVTLTPNDASTRARADVTAISPDWSRQGIPLRLVPFR